MSSFNFGTPKTTNQPSVLTMTTTSNTLWSSTQASAGFSLASNPQPTSTGFSLGGTIQAPTGYSLGITNQPFTGFSLRTTSASVGFSLGTTQVSNAVSLDRNQTSTSFSLGATPIASTGFSLATTSQTSAGFSLGGTTQAFTGFSLSGTTQASTDFLLGVKNQPSTGFSLATSKVSTPGFSLSTSRETTVQATTIQTTSVITSKAISVTSQSDCKSSAVQRTNFQRLVDLINKWTVSLQNQEKQFINETNEISVWDIMLKNQSTKLIKLNDILEQKEKEQVNIENEIEFLTSQQKELEDCLIPIEEELQSAEVLSSLNNKREPIYKAAQEIHNQVKLLSGDIREIVNNLNKANSKNDSDSDLDTISQTFNCHMTALQYMEHNAKDLSSITSEMIEEHSRFCTDANDNSLSSVRK